MKKSNKSISGLIGFLEGYKASNIASVEPTLEYHFDEIKDRINHLNDDKTLKSLIFTKMLLRSLLIIDKQNIETFDKTLKFGESLKSAVFIAKGSDEFDKITHNVLIRSIIFHFLELADNIDDKKINDIAIQIGESF